MQRGGSIISSPIVEHRPRISPRIARLRLDHLCRWSLAFRAPIPSADDQSPALFISLRPTHAVTGRFARRCHPPLSLLPRSLSYVVHQIGDTHRVAPLVVIPGHDLGQVAADDDCFERAEDRRAWIALQVAR